MTEPDPRAAAYRTVWEAKPVLRSIYADLYCEIAARLAPGRSLEVGGRSGNLEAFAPDVVSSDIRWAPWLDVACAAQRLPFGDGSVDNFVLMNVFHHIERPLRFLREAALLPALGPLCAFRLLVVLRKARAS
jgi:hypothetical protein